MNGESDEDILIPAVKHTRTKKGLQGKVTFL